MSFCADLTERNTRKLGFKIFFSVIMMTISLLVYPQPSLFSPYETFLPIDQEVEVSTYLVVDSVSEASGDLSDIKDNNLDSVMIIPDMTELNVTQLHQIINHSTNDGLSTSLSLGGTLISKDSYMSDGYQDDLTDIVNELINRSAFGKVDVIELLPFINAPDKFGSGDGEMETIFGATFDDVKFLGEMVELISDESVKTRTSVHLSYLTSFRTLLKRLGEIEKLDQVGVGIFQPHINTVPTTLFNGIKHAERITGKDVVISPVGFSTHDDAHNIYMQDSWFWSCVDVASSLSIKELTLWQWKDRDVFPFIVSETIVPKYGIKDKPTLDSVKRYIDGKTVEPIGITVNIIEIGLGIFSTSGSTGVISGNIILALLGRILIGLIVGRKCKINGKLIGVGVFVSVLIFHISMGALIINSPNWWMIFPTYFYLYSSILAGVFQIQTVSTIVRHKKVFSFCENTDAEECSSDFFQL